LWSADATHDTSTQLIELASAHPFLRDAVVDVLTPIFQQGKNWDSLVSLMVDTLPEDESIQARGETYKQVAEIYLGRLENHEKALEFYIRAIRTDIDLNYLLPEIDRLAEKCGKFTGQEALLSDLSDSDLPRDKRADLLMRMGTLSDEQLDDIEEAERNFQAVLDLDPEHLGALNALQKIYSAQERYNDLITICERKAALPIEVSERIDLYREIAATAEETEDSDKAESSWRAVLKLDAADVEALLALERIYRDNGDFGELVQVLDRRADLTDDVEDMARIKMEQGRVLEVELHDQRGSASAYEEALELEADSLEIMTRLEQLYEEMGDKRELSRIIEHRVQHTVDESVRIDALADLARIEEQLGHTARAIDRYEAVVGLDPEFEDAHIQLLRLYEADARWEDFCNAIDRIVGLTDAIEKQNEYRIRAAKVCELHLQDWDRAGRLAEQILNEEPEHQQAMWLRARVNESQHDDDDAIENYEALVATLNDGAEKIATLLSLGRLYLDKRANTSKALACFRDALAIDDGSIEARSFLKQVLYKRESWEALLPVLEAEYETVSTPQEKADLCYEMAILYRDQLDRSEDSLVWLKKGYDVRRSHRRIVESIIEYHTERSEWSEVTPLLGWLVSFLESKRHHEELAERAFELAQVYERVDESDKALRYYKVVHKYDSRNVANLLATGRLYFDAGEYDKALQTLQGLLLLQHDISDDAIRVDMFWYLARVCAAMGDKKKSRRHLQRLLDIQPDHREASELFEASGT
ncbi:MAG TPA: tetratricopeptide repeat protein, partial [Myxococcales bacterium]|nr:tetratricopeptide repeat protein [Myxococcales bacterium]